MNAHGQEGKAAVALALAALAVLAAAGIVILAREGGPRGREAPAAGAARSAPPAAAAPAEAGPPEGGALVSREEGGTLEVALPPGQAEALMAAARPHLARRAAFAEALAAARAGRLDPADLGLKLHEILAGTPEGGALALEALLDERDPKIAFKLAQALAGALDDDRLRRAAVDALRDASPEVRAVGLMAFLGRGEPEVVSLAAASFGRDAPEARATAGFLLNQAALPPAVAERVREAARSALLDRDAPPRLIEESLGLLGHPGAPDGDLFLLERALLEAQESAVRARAFGALVETGAPPARLRSTFERALADPSTPDPLADAIRAWLASH